jgi:hypothetical protein
MIMSLVAEGISKVRAFDIPAGIWLNGDYFACPRVAIVKWHSDWTDKLHQVYVNGRHAGTTVDVNQRQLVVPVPNSPATAVRIEVFAVEPRLAHIDFSGEVPQVTDTGRVKLRILRSQLLPLDSVIQIYSDNGTGDIDYDNPLCTEPIRVWPSFYDKAGFGTSRFGEGDFGFDSVAAVGFGRSDFGFGQFGLDADSLEWISEPLSKGVYRFAAKVIDKNGSEGGAVETEAITVITAAHPATALTVLSFDKQTNQLMLSIN